MDILAEIFAHKQQEVEQRRQALPLERLRALAEQAPAPLDFVAALLRSSPPQASHPPALIAEVKCASPSQGVLKADFDPLGLAGIYAGNGAAAISVLTDEKYFKGHLDTLRQIARARDESWPAESRLPLLCKDLIYDPYQIYAARQAGADAVLLIAAALPSSLLQELHDLTNSLGMAALVEIHNGEELQRALDCGPKLLGINNRNLRDFSIDLETTLRLRPYVPASICLVAESGIRTRGDIDLLMVAGVDAILVGEALVTAPDVAARVRSFAQR